MPNKPTGSELIHELLSNSEAFYEKGRAYDLLQHYFDDLNLETLSTLLGSDDLRVRRVGVWIASELGGAARDLLPDAVGLVYDEDRYIAFHAIEIVAVCATGEEASSFAHVVQALSHNDEVIRRLAMRLVSDVDDSQLCAASASSQPRISSDELHRQGLLAVRNVHSLDMKRVSEMLGAKDPLLRRYGAICGRRLIKRFPELISIAASLIDPDISRFASETIKDNLDG